MFRITRDPSSGNFIQCLAKITVMVGTDVVDVNTDCFRANGHDRIITVILAKYCLKVRDDGSLVIRNMLEQF